MKHDNIAKAYISEFFQTLADIYVSGAATQLTDLYELPSAHCYEDGMRVSSTLEELEVEHSLLTALLGRMRVARAQARIELSTASRDNFLPVRVNYKLIDWDGQEVRSLVSQYYCKVDGPDKMRIALTSCPIKRSVLDAPKAA